MGINISAIYLSLEQNGDESYDCTNENTDVIVALENGEKYIATFFSYDNIASLRTRHKLDGSFLDGKYFWMKSMVLIDDCCRKSIERVVLHLIDEGDFREVFLKISSEYNLKIQQSDD